MHCQDGAELATHVVYYPRWQAGHYCQPVKPVPPPPPRLSGVHGAGGGGGGEPAHAESAHRRARHRVDSTGSTPPPSTERGACCPCVRSLPTTPTPCSCCGRITPPLEERRRPSPPCATAASSRLQPPHRRHLPPEWFWAKILHVSRADAAVRAAACNWVELCDWVPPSRAAPRPRPPLKRGRRAAGHKSLWHPSWGGLPPADFLNALDPLLTEDLDFPSLPTAGPPILRSAL